MVLRDYQWNEYAFVHRALVKDFGEEAGPIYYVWPEQRISDDHYTDSVEAAIEFFQAAVPAVKVADEWVVGRHNAMDPPNAGEAFPRTDTPPLFGELHFFHDGEDVGWIVRLF